MNRAEAIKRVKQVLGYAQNDGMGSEEDEEAINLAISALEAEQWIKVTQAVKSEEKVLVCTKSGKIYCEFMDWALDNNDKCNDPITHYKRIVPVEVE